MTITLRQGGDDEILSWLRRRCRGDWTNPPNVDILLLRLQCSSSAKTNTFSSTESVVQSKTTPTKSCVFLFLLRFTSCGIKIAFLLFFPHFFGFLRTAKSASFLSSQHTPYTHMQRKTHTKCTLPHQHKRKFTGIVSSSRNFSPVSQENLPDP